MNILCNTEEGLTAIIIIIIGLPSVAMDKHERQTIYVIQLYFTKLGERVSLHNYVNTGAMTLGTNYVTTQYMHELIKYM